MPHICISESDQHWSRLWPVAYLAPSHYMNQCFSFAKLHLKILSVTWQPFCAGEEDLMINALRLVNELSSLAATCLLRSVSKVQTLEAGWIFPTGTDLWCACLTFCPPSHSYNKTSYPTRRCACGGHGGAAADENKISQARFVEKRQWFRGDMIYANQWEYFADHRKTWKAIVLQKYWCESILKLKVIQWDLRYKTRDV